MEEAIGKEFLFLFIFSHGRKERHESRYSYIKVIGITPEKDYYDLGWHDIIVSRIPFRIDSIGKNIFVLKPDSGMRWKVKSRGIFSSSLQIGDDIVAERLECLT
ncbi:MAG: hypothetical protein HXS54_05785 [Theionarchaea archaeon]|nr:hypothetical protein [Theionarchaea archaeon]